MLKTMYYSTAVLFLASCSNEYVNRNIADDHIIKATKFVVVDKSGTSRAEFGLNDEGIPCMVIRDAKSDAGVGFGVDEKGSPSVELVDRKGLARVELGMLNAESPFILLRDHNPGTW